MTNEQMKPGRFHQWHIARRRIAFIQKHLEAGHMIQLTTYMRATRYQRKHIGMFKATRSGAYVQSGRQWLCIDGCDLRAFPQA